MRNLLLLLGFSLFSFTLAQAQCNNLFFSEYLEGASNNKAIEIYNASPITVNLTNYVIYRYNNGSPTPTDSLFPQGTLAPGAVYVAGNPSAVVNITSVSDTLHTITFFNGDDAMSIHQISPPLQLDVIGQIGVDPGVNWVVGTGATSEFTLVRMAGIQQGTTNWTVGATQWDVHPQNTFTFLGSHSMTPCLPPVAPVIQFATASTLTSEGVPSVNVTVNISNVSSINPTSVTVALNLGASTATGGGVDFSFTDTTLTWPANDSTPMTLTIPIVDDAIFEGVEALQLDLTNPTNNATIGGNATHTVTIQDNDYPTYPIGTVNTVDSVGVADSTGVTCWVHGVVYGVNMRPSGLQFTIIDPTGGIGVFTTSGTTGYVVTETDSIKVLGTIGQFNGLTQVNVDSVVFISTGSTLKTPTVVTTLVEANESDLLEFRYAWLVNPTQWTGAGSGFNVDVTDGTNTIQVRIDADVDLYSMPAPVGMFHVRGIGGQFDNSSPYTSGYQLLPRYSDDILYLPVAALGADTSFCAGGSTVLGTANSGDTYLWNTGDTTQTITVSAAGTYSVIVTDTTLNETAFDTISVVLLPLPVAAFTINSGSNPTFSFTDGSSDATSWTWNFGDGSPVSTQQNPSHTFAPGSYTVTLIATNACGSDTITDTLTALVGVENGLTGQVVVAPNPSNGQFTVELKGNGASFMDVSVFDALGRCVHRQTGGLRQTVAVEGSEGMYLVRVSTAEGQVVRRIVLQ